MKKIIIISIFVLLFIFNINIVKAEELEEGKNIKEYVMPKGVYDMSTNKVLLINRNNQYNEYLVAGGIKKEIYQSDYSSVGYLAYYKNEELMWSKTFEDFGQGIVNDICYNEDLIGLILTIDKNGIRKIVLLEISINGEIRNIKELNGSKDTFGFRIFYYNTRYYFIGQTYANDGDYFRYDSNNSVVVVGRINSNSFSECFMSFIGNNLDNYLNDVIMIKDNIYLYMQFSGSGYYHNEYNSDKFWALVCVNDRCDYVNHIEYDDCLQNEFVNLIGNEDLIVVSKKYNSEKIIFRNYNSDFDLIDYYHLETNDSFNVHSFCCSDNNDLIIMFGNGNELNVYCFNQKYVITYNGVFHIEKEIESLSNCFYSNGKLYFTGDYYYNHKRSPFLYRFVDIVCTKINEVSFLGTKVNKDNENEKEFSSFGEYIVKYEYFLEGISFVREEVYNIPLNINIKNKGEYDIGLSLEFNCQGILNNERITSGYKINKEGIYVLELLGNGVNTIYTFSVKKIGLTNIDIENEKIVFNVTIDEANSINQNNNNVISLSKNIENNDIINGGIFISLIMAIIGLSFGLFIPIKRK